MTVTQKNPFFTYGKLKEKLMTTGHKKRKKKFLPFIIIQYNKLNECKNHHTL